jgi:D-glycero-D-manno-heptose 1,7-bisphosphate phosphatase
LACCYHNGVTYSQNSASAGTLCTVFLDRDGVINQKMPEGGYVTSWANFQLLPGVPEAIAQLNQAGLRVVVVSNQRGIALGLYSAQDVETIHANLQSELKKLGAHVDAFYFCPHDKEDCNCRKPLPGMFESAKQDFAGIRAAQSVMIGDSLSDIEFGLRLGMRTIFVDCGPNQRKEGSQKAIELANQRCSSLSDAVDLLLSAHSRAK